MCGDAFINRKGRHSGWCLPYSLFAGIGLTISGFLHGAQATGTNVDRFAAFQSDFTDIGLPASVGLPMRVRDVLTEHNALSADTAFCHF